MKPQRPSGRQCGPIQEEWELICTKRPTVFISFDLVVATLEVYAKKEIFRNANKVNVSKLFIAIVGCFACLFHFWWENNDSKSWQITPLREKTALGEEHNFWHHYAYETRLFVNGQKQTKR